MKQELIKIIEDSDKSLSQLIDNDIETYIDKLMRHATIKTQSADNKVVGFIAYYNNNISKRVAFLSMIVIHPSYVNNGLGGYLLNEAILDLTRTGFIRVDLVVLKSNEKAIKFYEKHNFQIKEMQGDKLLMQRYL